MNEQEIRRIVEQTYQEIQTRGQFGLQKISKHSHNSIDNIRINRLDLINSKVFSVGIYADSVGNPSTAILLSGILKPKHISFSGILTNAVIPNPATVKASIVGEAYLGDCFTLIPGSGFSTISSNIIQVNTSTFMDAGNTFRVQSDPTSLASVDSSALTANIKVVAWSDTTITFTSNIDGGYYIYGTLIIS